MTGPGNHCDIVLTDINTPVMDGRTLLSRQREGFPMLRSVIVWAYGDMANVRTALNLARAALSPNPSISGTWRSRSTKPLPRLWRAVRLRLQTREEDVLILSGINMPGMNGLGLLKTVKSKHRHLRVFMNTRLRRCGVSAPGLGVRL
ncbi:MAG: hypothetical protein JNL98_27045 [Bryobacterales bacterium]|nr:hypothetical protein [Bryobacterales bacterium]